MPKPKPDHPTRRPGGLPPNTAFRPGLGGSLRAKVFELLSRRLVVAAARRELDDPAFAAWLRHVSNLQGAIYEIDQYYERSDRIDRTAEAPMWLAVKRALVRDLPGPSATLWRAYGSLVSYADVERRLHAYDTVDLREFPSVLTLKCADVRMARALIWSYSGRIVSQAESAFWGDFDECWELIEDLEDLQEDGRDWNFNFWLYSFMSGGSTDRGVMAVADLLQRKLVDLQRALQLIDAGQYFAAQALRNTLRIGESALRNRYHVYAAIAAGRAIPYVEQLLLCEPRPLIASPDERFRSG